MPKTPTSPPDSAAGNLRAIPSVERILSSPTMEALVAEFGRDRTKDAVVEHLAALRRSGDSFDFAAAASAIREAVTAGVSSALRRVINATGIIIHTNLGRSPIDKTIWEAAGAIVSGYSNLEFDLESGERGSRHAHLEALCSSLFGCEAAILTNNNAAGTLLLLAATAAGKEVIVSRGELVEIGGSFRVPDVIQQGGAKLKEVGTTNRTRAADYANAANGESAAILRVHRSNFDMFGFTETPHVEAMVEVAREKSLPMLYDEGSGRVVDLSAYGFARAETIRELFAKGVDAITCSTDKLIGATQGGLILGSLALIRKCRRHPLMRALRAGKESYAVVAATLRAFATGRHEQEIAIYRMLAAPIDELRQRAAEISAGTAARIVESRCALGGGTTPSETISSIAIEVAGGAEENRARFLANDPPIAGRIADDKFTLEVRTLDERDREDVRAALLRAR